MEGSRAAASQWQLPPALQLHILSLLPPNDRALSARLVSPDAAAALSGPKHCTVFLYQPLPPHAAPWGLPVEGGQQVVRQLPFRHKLQLMCMAAASGSEVNLEVALALLQPSIFPELLQLQYYRNPFGVRDPGVAAVRAGRPQLLPWLLRHCPWLVTPPIVLSAAVLSCDLAVLQATWEALQGARASSAPTPLQVRVDTAAGSLHPDAVAKMEWLLAVGKGSCSLQENTAAAAAISGDLGRLRWLRERGCPMGEDCMRRPYPGRGATVLGALEHADLAVAQWMVDEAGVELPVAAVGGWEDTAGTRAWGLLYQAAARTPDAVAKWQWLQSKGGPPLQGAEADLALMAAGAGQLQAVQYLLSLVPPPGPGGQGLVQGNPEHFGAAAAASGSIPMAEFLRQAGATFGPSTLGVAYKHGRDHGRNMGMVRWLATAGGVRADSLSSLLYVVQLWAGGMPTTRAGRADLLEAVQLAVGAGPHVWQDEDIGKATLDILERVPALGELALVQYLLPMLGHEPDGATFAHAVRGGCEALLEWLAGRPGLLEQLSEWTSLYIPAAKRGDRGTLTALRRLGVPWGREDTVACAVAERCPVPALRWLVEQGAPVGSREEMEAALERVSGQYDGEAKDWLRRLAHAGQAGEAE